MAATINPRRLRPSDALRLLNSGPLGAVVDARRLRQHMDQAGYRIGDGRSIDLARYSGWMCAQRHLSPRPTSMESRTHNGEDYETHRQREQERQRELSKAGRDIGAIPPVANPERRAACERNFRLFCETYGKAVFVLEWSPDHLIELERIDQSVLNGGLFAMADPRGDGKTTRCEWGALYALLNGHRRFGALIGATEGDAEDRLGNVKAELENNDLLLEDYPEVCFPIRALEGIVARAQGQLCQGERTRIEWGAKQIVLPTIPGSRASGAIVKVAGITGRIRGMNFKRQDGSSVRPDFVIVDDPQTDESARSLTQSRQRESTLAGAVLGLAGPGKDISGFMPCTVIQPDDMADRILDPKRHPEWNGMRTRMVKAWPKRMELWDRYVEMRKDSMRRGAKGEDAQAYYAANRSEMDEGALVSWEARRKPDELSALQHAMNILCDRGREVFHAEYQNDPLPLADATRSEMNADEIVQRLNGVPRTRVPVWATTLTAFVDVQDACLWWMVCAWGDGFTGAVVDYGAWPDQGRPYFTQREVKRSLAKAYPKASGAEGRWYAGLDALGEHVLGREWHREDGATLRVSRLLIDANYPKSSDTVRQWCRETVHAAAAMPSHGKYVGASSIPFSQYKRKPGEQLGQNWLIRKGTRAAVRHVSWSTNDWKSFFVARMTTAKGDKGSLSLFGRDGEAHRMLADQWTAERAVPVESKGRRVDEWKAIPGRDNHLFDCVVGCMV
ncbi:MAG: phage terminase large subunit family protein, partial [Phycisphaerae bacterium]|nr:phage terminase large subunit family protein [Phycisphaerae bacterium]